MARRRNIVKDAERYSQYLLYEATGGAMGREPPKSKNGNPDPEFKVDFNTKRALLDSLIKLATIKNKVDPADEEDGIETYREMLNGGAATDRGITPEAALGAAILSGKSANGHAKDDDLIE